MKTKKHWTKWFANKFGFSGHDWASQWLKELVMCGLPGPDYVLRAPNSRGDTWLDRPADFADARRMLHLMLMVYMGMKAEDAVTYNPHGFRHVLVSVGQQPKTFGIVKEGDLEVIGHWSRGSSMPRKYDAGAGVTEMCIRTTLLQQIRQGWRPASEGSLPPRPIGGMANYQKGRP